MCINMCMDMCTDLCIGVCMCMCISMCMGMEACASASCMCIDMCMDMCIATCVGVCIDRHVYRHVHRHVYGRVYKISGEWKTNTGTSLITALPLTKQYKMWAECGHNYISHTYLGQTITISNTRCGQSAALVFGRHVHRHVYGHV